MPDSDDVKLMLERRLHPLLLRIEKLEYRVKELEQAAKTSDAERGAGR